MKNKEMCATESKFTARPASFDEAGLFYAMTPEDVIASLPEVFLELQ